MGIFNDYDIRGVVPDDLDEAKSRRIGYQFARHVRGKTIVVGRDMRQNSERIAGALVAGINDAGADVIRIGEVPTPVTYFAIGHLGADGGIAVTASHHPGRHNGFKLCREDAIPIGSKTGLAEIEEAYDADPNEPVPEGERGGERDVDVLDAYLDHVLGQAEIDRKLHVVVDAGNGMAGVTVPRILERLPTVEMTPLFFEPDDSFPNHEPDPQRRGSLATLRSEVVERKADLGVAFDADADRIAFVDERGRRIASDLATALLARWILARHPDTPVIYDLRSSWVVPEEIRAYRGYPVRERVGHAYIRATMRDKQSYFAGEQSGHYYFRDNYYSDCADMAMLMVLSLMCREGKKLSALAQPLTRYVHSGEISFRVDDQEEKILEIAREFAGAKIDYLDGITVSHPTWWFNVRMSSTEPVLRLNMEARTLEGLEAGRDRVVSILGEPA